jgi:hypothetical protein
LKLRRYLEKLGKQPLKDERDEEANEGESSIEQQTHVLNDTLIFFLRDQATMKSSHLEI